MTSTGGSDEAIAAQAALDAVRSAESSLARQMNLPLWRHALPAGMVGILLIAMTLGDGLYLTVAALVILLGFLRRQLDRYRFGMRISPKRSRSSLALTLVMIAVAFGAVMFVRSYAPNPKLEQSQFWIVWGITVVALLALNVWRFEAIRRELREGRA